MLHIYMTIKPLAHERQKENGNYKKKLVFKEFKNLECDHFNEFIDFMFTHYYAQLISLL